MPIVVDMIISYGSWVFEYGLFDQRTNPRVIGTIIVGGILFLYISSKLAITNIAADLKRDYMN